MKNNLYCGLGGKKWLYCQAFGLLGNMEARLELSQRHSALRSVADAVLAREGVKEYLKGRGKEV